MTQATKSPPKSPKAASRVRADIDRCLDAEMFKALSDPTRLTLLACLAKCARPCSVGEIAECCAVDLSVVSRHLAALARAGVAEARKEGRTVLYTVPHLRLAAQLRALADAIEGCCAPPVAGSCCGGGSDCR